MKSRPILFSAPMVRALLAGTKTQTRRVFKVRGPMGDLCAITAPTEEIVRFADGSFHYLSTSAMSGPYPCPYGSPGERLWVRETWQLVDPIEAPPERHGRKAPFTGCQGSRSIPWVAAYRADGELTHPEYGKIFWTPSIHMPRWASRITLDITDVRVERLQSISEADAIAEGIERPESGDEISARDAYRELWLSINGAGSWDLNPWVWVVEFKRVTA